MHKLFWCHTNNGMIYKGCMVRTWCSRAASLDHSCIHHVLVIQLIPFLPRKTWFSAVPLGLPLCPPSSTTQCSLHRCPPTALLGHQVRMPVSIWGRQLHSEPRLCIPSSLFNADLLGNPQATHRPCCLFHYPHCFCPRRCLGPSPWQQFPSSYPCPAAQWYHPHLCLLIHLPYNDCSRMRHLQRVRPQVGPSYLIPTNTNLHPSCTLSHSESRNSCIVPTFRGHHPHWHPSWCPPCISPGPYRFLPYTSCTSTPPPGPTYEGNPRDCLFSLPCSWAFTCWLPGLWVPQLSSLGPGTPPISVLPKLLFFLLMLQPYTPLLSRPTLRPLWWPWTHCCWLSLLGGPQQQGYFQRWRPRGDLKLSWWYKSSKGVLLRYKDRTLSFPLSIGLHWLLILHLHLLFQLHMFFTDIYQYVIW